MKVAIGCDDKTIGMKNVLIEVLEERGIEYKDFGVKNIEPIDYSDIAARVIKEIQNGNFSKGILLCETGIGMAICANKFKGIKQPAVMMSILFRDPSYPMIVR